MAPKSDQISPTSDSPMLRSMRRVFNFPRMRARVVFWYVELDDAFLI